MGKQQLPVNEVVMSSKLRNRIRAIIQEEIAHPRDELGKNVADVQFPILVGYEGASEIAYDQDELDSILDTVLSADIAYSLDSLADVEVRDLPAGVKIELIESSKSARVLNAFEKRLLKIIREQTEQPDRMTSLLAYIQNLPEKLQDTHTSIEAEAMAVEDEGLFDEPGYPAFMEMVDQALEILWGAMQEISDITEQMEREGLFDKE